MRLLGRERCMCEAGPVALLAMCCMQVLPVYCVPLSNMCCGQLSLVPHVELQPLRNVVSLVCSGCWWWLPPRSWRWLA